MITIDEITIIRDGREIIYDYSEQIPAGSITVIVGPNGSGKSTLLAAIAGDIAPAKGTITIDDHHPILTAPETLARMRSMVIQNQNFSVGFTVREIIEMAGPAEEIMKSLKIEQLTDRFVTTLSGGEAQRVAIAQAIAQDVPVLLLDEPLAAQDIQSRRAIIDILQGLAESGKTVVVVAHSAETELSWADKIIKQFL
jgi:iron complex transport system ATP-binding protein